MDDHQKDMLGFVSKAICSDDHTIGYFLIAIAYSVGIAQHDVVTY